MAKVGVNLKINVSNIDKTKLFSGAKGTYLDAQVFIDLDELDQYGNSGMITQAVSKEDRNAGQKGAILGNCKVFWKDAAQAPQQQQAPQQKQAPADFDDDIPFAPIGLMYSNMLMHCI